jgi:hypothetical protein
VIRGHPVRSSERVEKKPDVIAFVESKRGMMHRIPKTMPLLVGLAVAGCSPDTPPVQPRPAQGKAGQAPSQRFEPVDLGAEDLADILRIDAWTFRYSGGPARCWLEIEETGQQTMPRRIPDEGYIAEGVQPPREEGTILLYWIRDSPETGGRLTVRITQGGGSGGYSYGLNRDAFVYGWKSFGATSTLQGRREPIAAQAGREVTLLEYDAREYTPEGREGGRRVRLLLKGIFPGDPAGK